jgi:hypothetical protein
MKSLIFSLLIIAGGTEAVASDLDSLSIEKFLTLFAEPGGEVISGSVLSSANTHGGLPHFAGGFGVGFLTIETTNPVDTSQNIRALIPTSFLHGSLGITKGFNLGPTVGGTGSIDLLARFGIVPMRGDYGDIAENSPLIYGGGVKVGLLRHGIVSPAISVTTTYTTLQNADFTFASSGDTATTALDLSTLSFHVDVSKSFIILAPYAGIGWDSHKLKATYEIDLELFPPYTGEFEVKPKTSRIYGGVELTLALLKFYLEGGKTGDNGYFTLGAKAGI